MHKYECRYALNTYQVLDIASYLINEQREHVRKYIQAIEHCKKSLREIPESYERSLQNYKTVDEIYSSIIDRYFLSKKCIDRAYERIKQLCDCDQTYPA